ncbi:MAG: hypothetical protein M3281_04400, partial [Chloroflexota bacterium]|nr:hypothetical protein [Chloroflexota bacterium]
MPTPLQKNRVWLSGGVSEPASDGSGDYVYYVRSGDGRRAIVRQHLDCGLVQTLTAEPRPSATVGYGGGTFGVRGDVLVYAAGRRLVAVDLRTGQQSPITPEYEGVAVPALSPDGGFVAFVIEQDGHAEVLLTDTQGAHLPVKLSCSPAFAANPTISSDGHHVAWMEWDANRMPWDQSRLQIACLSRPSDVAGAPADMLPLSLATLSKPNVSYANPQFSPDGSHLAYTSDESGWRSLYLADPDGHHGERVDTGLGEIGAPDWSQGQFAVRWGASGEHLYCVRRYRSTARLLKVSASERKVAELDSQLTAFGDVAVLPGQPEMLGYVGSAPTMSPCLVTRVEETETVRASGAVGLNDPDGLISSEVVEWPTVDGTTIYGVLYRAASSEAPRPLLVSIHGGPTSESSNGWNPQAQYFAG